jgi:hypothetical protein
MNRAENFTPIERADSYDKLKEEKSSTLNETKLELKTMQIELDYSIKT